MLTATISLDFGVRFDSKFVIFWEVVHINPSTDELDVHHNELLVNPTTSELEM